MLKNLLALIKKLKLRRKKIDHTKTIKTILQWLRVLNAKGVEKAIIISEREKGGETRQIISFATADISSARIEDTKDGPKIICPIKHMIEEVLKINIYKPLRVIPF